MRNNVESKTANPDSEVSDVTIDGTVIDPCRPPVVERMNKLFMSRDKNLTHFDLRTVSLRNLLPLNLLCGSYKSILGRPLLGGQDHGLQNLDRFEPVLLP